MPAIIMVTVWRFAPYFMVIFLAALLALPEDYYEAAELDGAGAIRRFIHITLPLLMPTIFFVVVVSALLCARIFLMPYLITGGGPGNATRVLSMLIYETGFSYLKMGQAAAISVVLFTIMMVFTALQIRLFARSEQVYHMMTLLDSYRRRPHHVRALLRYLPAFRKTIGLALLATLAFAFLIPILWMTVMSFQEGGKMFDLRTEWIPAVWHFENYPNAIVTRAFRAIFHEQRHRLAGRDGRQCGVLHAGRLWPGEIPLSADPAWCCF